MISFLFGGDDGKTMAARIDRRIDSLPGLAGLDLIENARLSLAGEGSDHRRERLDVLAADDHIAETPALATL